MTRREIFERLRGVLAAAAWASWSEVTAGRPAAGLPSGVRRPAPTVIHQPVGGRVWRPTEVVRTHFFTAEEKELVATVADLIIPADEVSASAREAGVHEWIDFIIANAPANVQQQWRDGLATLDRLSQQSYSQRFQQLAHQNRAKLLKQLAISEFAPTTPGERFFVLAKQATVNGYYTSKIGLIRDLHYSGGTFVAAPESACHGREQKASGSRR